MSADSERMRSEWDERAEKDALHFVETAYDTTDIEHFFAIGERKAERLIDPVLENWEEYPFEDATALDVGCGVGRMTRTLADRFDHVIGLDVSEKMVERARSLNDEYENIAFYSTDGESYPHVDDGSIAFVFSYEVFQHFPSNEVTRKNVEEISRVLAPDCRASIHFRPPAHTGFASADLFGVVPIPSKFVQYVPSPIRRLYSYLDRNTDYAGLKTSDTWTGTSVSPSELWRYCERANLHVLRFVPDSSHDIGHRFFCIAEKRG